MRKTANIGLIGCGARLKSLLRHVPGIGSNIRVTAVCDPSRQAAEQAKKEFNPKARVYHNHSDLSASADVDWVFIGSFNCFHREHAVTALMAGKNVFCEKPLATSIADSKAILKACEKSGRIFCVGFTLRYSPHYRRIKQLITENAVGRIISMEFNETLHIDHGGYIHSNWRRFTNLAGTHLLEKCCHDMDLAIWMLDSIPRRVASFGGLNFFVPENRGYVKKLGKAPNGRPAFSSWEQPGPRINPFTAKKDIIDNQVAILEFNNNVRATFHTNCCTNIQERRMYICGTEGTMRADIVNGLIELAPIRYNTEIERIRTNVHGGHGGGDEILGRELADAILKDNPPPTTVYDGLKSAVTCFGIDKAMESGKVVDMAHLWKKAGISLNPLSAG